MSRTCGRNNKTVSTRAASTKHKKPPERAILSISGDSLRTARVTLRAPLWLFLASVICLFLVAGKMSPDVVAQIASLLIQIVK